MIRDQDTILKASTERITRTDTNSLPKPRCHYNDIQTITSFISINDSPPIDLSPHSFENTNYHDLLSYSFLSSPLPFYRPRTINLSKTPNTYHEAMSRPDKDVWVSAMKCKFDSLEERKAFERTSLSDG
jgi:hypothetical protein